MKTTFAQGIQPGADFRSIPLDQISRSPLNPRRAITGDQLEELADSIREKGIVQPVLVRGAVPVDGEERYELVCGHRRLAAAQLVGLESIPAILRELDDQSVLEIQVIENLHRADLHPLEEAESYRRLLLVKGYDVARVAEKIGRSIKYVYDRVKLLELTKEAKALFLADKISAGHAILLARLSAKDQARALDPEEPKGLFEAERWLWNPDAEEEQDEDVAPATPLKTRSVREFQAWIDEHVRSDAKAMDPMLFPETVATLEQAKKIIPITHAHYIPPEAREGRTFGPRSWKRADGLKNSKTCERAVTGFVAVGPGRGDAFAVCIAKEKCDVHWGAELQRKERRAKAQGSSGAPESASDADRQRKEQAEREAARKQRWDKARPAILKSLAEEVAKLPAGTSGELARTVSKRVYGYMNHIERRLLPPGKTAEDLVRHLAFSILVDEAHGYDWSEHFPRRLKAFGMDVSKILNEVAPVQTSAKARDSGSGKTRAKRATKKGRKK